MRKGRAAGVILMLSLWIMAASTCLFLLWLCAKDGDWTLSRASFPVIAMIAVWLSVAELRVRMTSIRDRAERDVVEGRLGLMIESVHDYCIYMVDPAGLVTSWNAGAERSTEYSSADILGKSVDLLYPDGSDGRGIATNANTNATGRIEWKGWRRSKGGDLRWVHLTVSPFKDEIGRLTGFTHLVQDLTTRRHQEQRFAEETRLRKAIFEAATFAVFATDELGILKTVNPALERMLGYKAENIIGKYSLSLFHQADELRKNVGSGQTGESAALPDAEVLLAGPRLGTAGEQEWTWVRQNGSLLPVHLTISALRRQDGVVSGFVGIAYDITERRRQDAYIRHIAHHDALTNLPNRVLLTDRMNMAVSRARRAKSQVAVMLLDLDNFKRVNDSLGHHIGDRLLVIVADRLRLCIRDSDTVARLGGDEFVVVLDDPINETNIQGVAKRILDTISTPAMIDGIEIHITPSIGLAVFPKDGRDSNTLITNADTAMYVAKAGGRSGIVEFSPDMLAKASRHLETENAIRQAIKADEFTLHYQPQICVKTGLVNGMEALIRWPRPDGTSVSPGDFIPVAEESGLIPVLGDWVLQRACKDAALICRQMGRQFVVAVNLSPRQIAQPDIVDRVRSALGNSGLDPSLLELEITEGVLLSTSVKAGDVIAKIRGLGVRVAVDDFGTGYSSLSYITQFPVDTVKIDRSFVSNVCSAPKNAAVSMAIIAMAKSLKMNVVAEGVEEGDVFEFLRHHGCDSAQGFLFSKAIPLESFSSKVLLIEQSAEPTAEAA